MDMSQIKQIAQKLSFIKNYSAFVLPVILLIVFLILQFAVGTIMSRNLKSRITRQSIQKGKDIQRLSSQGVVRNQWEEEKKYMDLFEKDVRRILDLVKQSSQRELLSYKIFPEPKDTSILIFKEFGKNYRQAIEELLEKHSARQRPTDIEIKKVLEQNVSSASARLGSIGYLDSPAMFGGTFSSLDRLDSLGRKIVDYMCEATAKKASFYAKAADIAGYEFWDDVVVDTSDSSRSKTQQEHYQYKSIQQSVRDCWYWQIGYWIIEDIIKTISAMNSECNNVLDCPVKRFLSVDFASSGRGMAGERSSNRPSYITEDNSGLTPSFTNRVSNVNLDVVHFRFSVIIESESILGFMEELCSEKEHSFSGWTGQQPRQRFGHNQITVLRSSTFAVDKSDEAQRFYRYGDNAIVELELICEYVFERQGYIYRNSSGAEETIMPDFIWNREKIDEGSYNY